MRVEISHDILAKKIFHKASSEDRAYLRALKIIKDRHKSFSDTRTYLTQRELDFIEGYDKSLDIDLKEEEVKFIHQSKIYLKNRLWWKITSYVSLGIVAGGIIFFLSLYFNEKLRKQMGLLSDTQQANDYIGTSLKLMNSDPTHALFYADTAQNLIKGKNSSANHLIELIYDNNIFYKHVLSHKSGVYAVAISEELGLIATACKDHNVYLWNLEGKLQQILGKEGKGHTDLVNDVAFLGDSSLVSVSDDNLAIIWNLKTNKVAHTILHSEGTQFHDINAVCTSSQNPSLILTAGGGKDTRALVWNYTEGTKKDSLLHVLEHGSKLYDIALSAQSIQLKARSTVPIIATIGKEVKLEGGKKEVAYIKLWNSKTGELIGQEEQPERITSVDFHPTKNQLVTSSRDKKVRIFELKPSNGKIEFHLITEKEVHANSVRHVTFSPSGKLLLTSGWDNTGKIWRIKEDSKDKLELLHILKGHNDWLFKSIFTPDEKSVITTSTDTTVRVWTLDNKNPQKAFNEHTCRVSSVDMAGNCIISGSWDKTIKIYNLKTGKISTIKSPNGQDIEWVQFIPNSTKQFFVTAGKSIYRFNTAGKLLSAWEDEHKSTIKAVAFCHSHHRGDEEETDHYLVTGSRDGVVKIWKIIDGKLSHAFIYNFNHVGESDIFSVAFSPNGKYIAIGGKGGDIDLIKLPTTYSFYERSSVETLETLHTIEAHAQEVFALAFTSDNTLMSGGRDNTIKKWAIEADTFLKEPERILIAHNNSVRSLTQNGHDNSNQFLSTGGDGTVKVWNMSTFTSHTIEVYDDIDKQCDLFESFSACRKVDCPLVLKAVFSPDGKYIITANGNGSVLTFYTVNGLLENKEIYSDFTIE